MSTQVQHRRDVAATIAGITYAAGEIAWATDSKYLVVGDGSTAGGIRVCMATGSTLLVTVGTIVTGVWNGTTIAVANGGTGATSASGARTNLGLVIGTDVQAYDAELAAIAGLTSAANKIIVFTGSGTAALASYTPNAHALTLSADATIGGTNTGDQTDITGNAATVTVADAGGDTTCWVMLATSQTGNLAPATDAGLTFNATTNALTATTFIGALTGNASGSSGSCTGNAATATALQTGRAINGVTFDGTAAITVTAAAGTLTGTTLNSTVVTSSLTAVGTIITGIWNGTTIAVANGGTGSTSASGARTNLGVAIGSDVQAYNASALKRVVTVTIGDGTNVPAVNTQCWVRVPFGATITKWSIGADASGSAVVNVWKDTHANFPPTVADKITASAPPTLSSAQKNEDSTLTGWTTSITSGDWLLFNLDSVTTCKKVVVSLEMTLT